jgi:hypothetical protein
MWTWIAIGVLTGFVFLVARGNVKLYREVVRLSFARQNDLENMLRLVEQAERTGQIIDAWGSRVENLERTGTGSMLGQVRSKDDI